MAESKGLAKPFPVEKLVNRLCIPNACIPFVGLFAGNWPICPQPVNIEVKRIDLFWRIHARWCAHRNYCFPWRRMAALTPHGKRIAALWDHEWRAALVKLAHL